VHKGTREQPARFVGPFDFHGRSRTNEFEAGVIVCARKKREKEEGRSE